MTSIELELELKALKIIEENRKTLETFENDKSLVGNCYSSVKLNKRTFESQESFFITLTRLDSIELRTNEPIWEIWYTQTYVNLSYVKPLGFTVDVNKFLPRTGFNPKTYKMSSKIFQMLVDMTFESNEFLFSSFYSHLKVSAVKSFGETRRDDDTSKLFERIGTPFLPLTSEESRWLSYRGHPFVYKDGIYVNGDSIKLLDVILDDEQDKLKSFLGRRDIEHIQKTIARFVKVKEDMSNFKQ